ncbi:hypothetical protein E3N88_44242 [Mikania micrantha]|uniref:Uncharacterized protein n=1 Tax=Mikania micrantha TaxID=192012 RepID=A0A5N6LCL2_9ASTR|nr:hypothetical protein E3N88_44242 [Mikania micrantha]
MTIAKLEAGPEMDQENNTSNRYAKILTGSWWAQFRYGSNPWMARYVYSVMFLLANLLAWAVRDYGPNALAQMSSSFAELKTCEGVEDCIGTEGVLRHCLDHLPYLCAYSEPLDEKCIRNSGASGHWLTIISFVVALLAMVIATFSTGIDSKCFQSRKDDKQDEDDVPYGFGFFHLVFASGVMYFAMLLIGWNPHHTMEKWTIDVGWTSTWVRIVNEWVAVCVYYTVKGITLKSLSATRWESRVESVKLIRYQLIEIREALLEVRDTDNDPKIQSEAKSLSDNEIGDFEFLVSLVIWFELLTTVNVVSKRLQTKDVILDFAIEEIRRLINFFKNYREVGLSKAIDEAKIIAIQMGVDPTFSQRRPLRRKKQFDETSSEQEVSFSPEENYKVNL